MSTLDKTRDYGEVTGTSDSAVRYYQDDKQFDSNGEEIAVAPAPVEQQPEAQ